MVEISEIITCAAPPELADVSAFVAEWWGSAAGGVLPGEVAATTVFVVEFWDGCRFVGVTDMSILDAVDDLVASPFLDRRSLFVSDHCGQMGYVVRCVGSSIAQDLAEQVRSALMEQLAVDSESKEAGVVVGDRCVFAEVPKAPVRKSFSEWVKTREQGVSEGIPE